MHNSLLKKLYCPFCNFKFVPSKNFYRSKNRLIHGIISCRCDQYPIINGVLFLMNNKTKERALRFLLKERKRLKLFTEVPFFLLDLRVGPYLSVFLTSLFSRIKIFKLLSYSQVIKLLAFLRILKNKKARFLLKRTDNENFLPAIISSTLVKKGAVILDVGCGSGNLFHLLKKDIQEENLYGVDNDLLSLYLSKKYSCQKCHYFYLDLNYPLPFKSINFQYVFCSDTFEYVMNRRLLGGELERIINNQGLIIFNYLQNRKFDNYFTNLKKYSDILRGYISFFPEFNFSVFSERQTRRGILRYIKQKDIFSQAEKLKTFTLIFYRAKQRQELNRDITTGVAKLF